MNEILAKTLKELDEITEIIPETEKETPFGDSIKRKPYMVTMTDTKHFWKMFYADGDNYLSEQVNFEFEHIEHLKDYINRLDEPYRLKEGLRKAVEGYEGALRILEFYKVKEEIDGTE